MLLGAFNDALYLPAYDTGDAHTDSHVSDAFDVLLMPLI